MSMNPNNPDAKEDPATLPRIIRDSLSLPLEAPVVGISNFPSEDIGTWVVGSEHSMCRSAMQNVMSERDSARIALGDSVLRSAKKIAELKGEIDSLLRSNQTKDVIIRIQRSHIDAAEAEISRLRDELSHLTRDAQPDPEPTRETESDDWHQPNPLPRGVR